MCQLSSKTQQEWLGQAALGVHNDNAMHDAAPLPRSPWRQTPCTFCSSVMLQSSCMQALH